MLQSPNLYSHSVRCFYQPLPLLLFLYLTPRSTCLILLNPIPRLVSNLFCAALFALRGLRGSPFLVFRPRLEHRHMPYKDRSAVAPPLIRGPPPRIGGPFHQYEGVFVIRCDSAKPKHDFALCAMFLPVATCAHFCLPPPNSTCPTFLNIV